MKKFLFPLLSLLALGAFVSCSQNKKSDDDKKSADNKKAPEEAAIIKTTDGEMVIGFWPDVAPNTVDNFKKLANAGFYDGTLFHRIIKGFMIQGGDPKTKDPSLEAEWGTGGPGYKINEEFNDRKHEFGVISMARSADPNSAGSQFFICLGDADSPQMQSLNGQYTAFGKLIKGDDVLKKIGDSPVEMSGGGDSQPSKPANPVKIISIKIVPTDSVK